MPSERRRPSRRRGYSRRRRAAAPAASAAYGARSDERTAARGRCRPRAARQARGAWPRCAAAAGARAAVAAARTPCPTSATASPPTASCRWWWRCPRPKRRWPPCCAPATRCRCRWWRAAPAPGLSGGALPHALGVTLSLAKFNQHPAGRPASRARPSCSAACATWPSARRPRRYGLYYAPDPSSQIACTIGGNVAENSGGVHCLKYGLTLHNVLRVRGFTVEGEAVEFGCEALDAPGLDLLALIVGSEGMLAVITEVTVKLVPKPQLARCIMASFDDIRKAGDAVADDHRRRHHPGRAGDDGQADDAPRSRTSCTPATTWTPRPSCCARATARPKRWTRRSARMLDGADAAAAPRACEVSKDEAQRLKFWSGRKNAFPASGPHQPRLHVHGRHHPAQAPGRHPAAPSPQMEKKYGLRCCNVFHAGDGNLHPLILFDANDPDQLHRCELFGADILETSVAMGGTVTGEHGVGIEKLNSMCVQFTPDEREQMFARQARLRPGGTAQPGQGDPDAAALRRVRQDARARAACCPSPTCRGSDVHDVIDDPALQRADRPGAAARAAGSASCASAAAAPRTSTARRRTGEPLDMRGLRRHQQLRADRTGGHRALPARRWPSSRRRWPSKGQCLPSSRRTSAPARTVGGMVAAGLAGPGARRGGRACATTCSAPRCSTAAARC